PLYGESAQNGVPTLTLLYLGVRPSWPPIRESARTIGQRSERHGRYRRSERNSHVFDVASELLRLLCHRERRPNEGPDSDIIGRPSAARLSGSIWYRVIGPVQGRHARFESHWRPGQGQAGNGSPRTKFRRVSVTSASVNWPSQSTSRERFTQ